MRLNRLLFLAALAALAAGCRAPLGPGDTLNGHWASPDARFDVLGSTGVFTVRCQRAEFGPIVLDENRRFSAESVVFVQSGGVLHSSEDRLHIDGHFDGEELVLQLYVIRSQPPVSDPYVLTLSPGRSSDALVCNQ